MNWLWAAVLGAGLVLEFLSLADRSDRLQPATYWLRKLPWVTRFLGIAWLAYHFLIEV